jgi:hypothetical protein
LPRPLLRGLAMAGGIRDRLKMTKINFSQVLNYMSKNINKGGVAGGIYGLGFIGAAVYYLQHAATFWLGILGFLKAIVWPAMLVYKLLEFLKM